VYALAAICDPEQGYAASSSLVFVNKAVQIGDIFVSRLAQSIDR
jgi:hypothetical protein